jgi:hypothetical protein
MRQSATALGPAHAAPLSKPAVASTARLRFERIFTSSDL